MLNTLEITLTFPLPGTALRIVDGPNADELDYLCKLNEGAYPLRIYFIIETEDSRQYNVPFTRLFHIEDIEEEDCYAITGSSFVTSAQVCRRLKVLGYNRLTKQGILVFSE